MEHNGTLRRIKVFQSVPLCFTKNLLKPPWRTQNAGFARWNTHPPVKVFHCVPLRGWAGIIPPPFFCSPACTCGASESAKTRTYSRASPWLWLRVKFGGGNDSQHELPTWHGRLGSTVRDNFIQ